MMQPTVNVPPESFENRLLREMLSALNKEMTKLTEKIIADATADFEKQVRASIGTVAINLANYYTVERQGGNMVITVRLEGAK